MTKKAVTIISGNSTAYNFYTEPTGTTAARLQPPSKTRPKTKPRPKAGRTS